MKLFLPPAASRYLATRAARGPWQLQGATGKRFAGTVVIPSLAEGDNLFATLESLAQNTREPAGRWLMLVVINQRDDAPAADREQNRIDLARLARCAGDWPFALAWVDAASPGLELPARQGGVGLARKIGLDLALPQLDWAHQPLLACLDADTLVETSYLACLEAHFRSTSAGAAVLPFRHQPTTDPAQQLAIDRYELFLRSYVHGLELAGSPYAFATIGSALACTATAYVQCGGMNRRPAAEDFYFLDKLAKTVGVARLQGTRVYPSARASHRVPFGTGRSIARQLAGETGVVRFYPLAPFDILARWLSLVQEYSERDTADLLHQAQKISRPLADFLTTAGWREIWPRLQRNHAAPQARQRAFHDWFDGLKTLRLVHTLCDAAYPRSEDPAILSAAFARSGLLTAAPKAPEMLAQLRRHQEPESGQEKY